MHEIVDENIFNSLRIDPIFENTDFSSLVSLWFWGNLNYFYLFLLQTMSLIKDINTQNGI